MRPLKTLMLFGASVLLLQTSLLAQTTYNAEAAKNTDSAVKFMVDNGYAQVMTTDAIKKLYTVFEKEAKSDQMSVKLESGKFDEAKVLLSEVEDNKDVVSLLTGIIDKAASTYANINIVFIDRSENGLNGIRDLLFITYPKTMLKFTDNISGLNTTRGTLNSLIKAFYEQTISIADKDKVDAKVYQMLKELIMAEETFPGYKRQVYKTFQELGFTGVKSSEPEGDGLVEIDVPDYLKDKK